MTSKLGLWSAAAMSVAATACISCGQTAFAQENDRPARQRPFRDLVQRGGAAPVRPRHALPAFVLVRAVEGDVREGAQSRSRLRHRPLGHRAQPVNNPHNAPPAPNLAPASPRSRRPRRSAPRASANATTSMRSPCCTPTTTRSTTAPACRNISRRRRRWPKVSRRRRDADRLCDHPQRRGVADRQDLRQPAQGRRDPRADLQATAAASRRRPLPDPSLRLSVDRRARASMPRAATRRSRRRRRTPSTCRRISSPASATGRNRSPPISPP